MKEEQKGVAVVPAQNLCFWLGLHHEKTKGGDMKRMEREEYHKPDIGSKTIEIGAYDQNRCLFRCWSHTLVYAAHENRQPCMQGNSNMTR